MSPSTANPVPIPPGPRGSGARVVRHGANASAAPVSRCRAGGRRFVAAPTTGPGGEPERAVVRRLRAERVGIRAIAREALRLANEAWPAYSSATSRKDFAQHQLFAVLALETLLQTDYRGVK